MDLSACVQDLNFESALVFLYNNIVFIYFLNLIIFMLKSMWCYLIIKY